MADAAVLATLKQALSRYAGEDVACAYLFGSTARGESRASSEVDLAVLYEPEPALTVGSVLAGE
jgi:predicted nucleotidyltransferase